MFSSPTAHRRTGRFAWIMAWVGLVVGQVHALARFATDDGAADLQLPLTRAWAVPAADWLHPLLGWGDPDLVYATYGKVWLPVFLAFTLAAFAVRQERRPVGFEKGAWRVALTGYVWACLAVLGDYWTQWTGTPNQLLDISFLVGLPGLFLTLVGSTLLGVSLLRNRFTPRTSAWLLTIAIPFAVVITQITSMGNIALPMMFAFGIAGRRLSLAPSPAPNPTVVTARP